MLKSCQLAHSRYIVALEKKRNPSVSQEKSLKQKLKLEKITEAKEKKRALKAAIKSLETDFEEYSIAAKKENNLTSVTKANSFRVTQFVKRRKHYHL